jgi:hypothetical protein
MIDDLRLRPLPGQGMLARYPGIVLFSASTPDESVSVRDLVDLCASVSAADMRPGRALARRLAGFLGAAESEPPAFCAVGQGEGRIAIIVHGPMTVGGTTTDGAFELRGDESATWVDRLVEGEVVELRCGPTGAAAPVVPTFADLTSGVVPAGAFTLGPETTSRPPQRPSTTITPVVEAVQPSQAAVTVDDTPAETATDADLTEISDAPPPPADAVPAEMPPPMPTHEPSGAEEAASAAREHVDFESILLVDAEPDEPPAPLPVGEEAISQSAPQGALVKGVICARNHFVDPENLYCSVCGISMAQRTLNLVDGVRPSLGFLVFDDGTTFTLDADYVVGREPHMDERVEQGHARPLRIDVRNETLSRVHAEVRLENWHVVVYDRGSTNGTFIWDENGNTWAALQPGQPAHFRPGAHGAFGHRTFVYESPHEHRTQ